MQRLAWVDRKFSFDIPVGWLQNVISRLRGAEVRLASYASFISEEEAEFKPDGKWSIKEHIGHLIDLEDIHIERLHQFEERVHELVMADMKNTATENAKHNDSGIDDLLLKFRQRRAELIEHLQNLPEEVHSHIAQHPRLNTAMKPIDMAAFTAEHDDHHIHSIELILDQLNK